MRAILLPLLLACTLAACAPRGYHYETGSFTPTKNADNGAGDDPLVWCRQAGLDQRVPMSVCRGALTRAPKPPQVALDAQHDAIGQCVRRVTAAGYIQSYSGEIYELCARSVPQ